MFIFDTTKPIGLHDARQFIDENCRKAEMFKYCGMKPKHMLMPLDSGEGRTTFTDYVAAQYKQHHVLSFTCGLDDYLEYVLDGTLPQLRQTFGQIAAAAIYTNQYENVVSMDISAIANHLNESQLPEFIENASRLCKHAYVVFFISSQRSRNEERLVQKLVEAVPDIQEIPVQPYTLDELADMIIYDMTEHSIIVDLDDFHRIVKEMLEAREIHTAKGLIALSRELMACADYSAYCYPYLSKHAIEQYYAEWMKKKGV